MAQQPVATVWNEIRITGDGISITLYSEDADGVRVEDETRLTFEELQEMSGDMESLRLSDETYSRMGRDTTSLAEVRESLEEEGVRKQFSEGDRAIDSQESEFRANTELEVLGYADKQADEYYINDDLQADTVADVNPTFDSDERVVEAVYEPGGDTYAFPESRLEPVEET